ncbi:type II toxin-antitoxin system RelE/ParE family toxin [Immundisolibacter sp.]|uniref:type II toxin-antitoxin system RelE family toxin n=1 Tax=Immundisolibacter sp. TaxID=1934948 RepID=UPI003568AC8A
MPWTIDYTDTARKQLLKLDKQAARRIVDFMDERIASVDDPRSTGKALSGPLGGFWRYRVGDYRVICDVQDSAWRVLVVKIGNRREVYR